MKLPTFRRVFSIRTYAMLFSCVALFFYAHSPKAALSSPAFSTLALVPPQSSTSFSSSAAATDSADSAHSTSSAPRPYLLYHSPPARLPAPPLQPLLPASFCQVPLCTPSLGGGSDGCSSLAEGFNPLSPATVRVAEEGGCHWAKLSGLPVETHMCTHDPVVDGQVSFYLHSRGSWVAVEELEAFTQVACSPERPFMLDVGSNIGSYSVPAAALGCHTISFDPSRHNLNRVVESMRLMNALHRTHFYQNFVGAVHSHKQVTENAGNMGGTTFVRSSDQAVTGGNASFVVLDELFSLPSRPLSPNTMAPMEPYEVNFVKVDAEGCDVEIFFSAQRLLQWGKVPFFTIEFTWGANCQASCQAQAFVDFMCA